MMIIPIGNAKKAIGVIVFPGAGKHYCCFNIAGSNIIEHSLNHVSAVVLDVLMIIVLVDVEDWSCYILADLWIFRSDLFSHCIDIIQRLRTKHDRSAADNPLTWGKLSKGSREKSSSLSNQGSKIRFLLPSKLKSEVRLHVARI